MPTGRQACHHLLESLPAVGRCVIKRAWRSFSELSIHFLDKKFCIQYTLKKGSLEGESWSQLVSRPGKWALLGWRVGTGSLD